MLIKENFLKPHFNKLEVSEINYSENVIIVRLFVLGSTLV